MPEYDDATLERIMREGLELHAGDAADKLREPMPPELWLPRGRPWLRRTLVAAAAITVIGLGGGLVALVAGGVDRGPRPHIDGGAVGPSAVDTSGWRTESYAGVSLRVPPSWGLGGSPGDLGAGLGGTTVCVDDPGSPYVGRPVLLSDMCVRWRPETGPYPTTDAVWFASPLHPGTATVSGRTVQTIAVGGMDVSVFSDDVTFRRAILASAEGHDPRHDYSIPFIDDNGCSAEGARYVPPSGGSIGPDYDSLSVCVYSTVPGRGQVLLWSGQEDADHASAYADALQRTSATYDPGSCQSQPEDGTWVALGLHEMGGETRWDIVDFTCQQIDVRYGQLGTDTLMAPLVPATVEPWASAGIKTYVTGPTDPGDLAPYFRGLLG